MRNYKGAIKYVSGALKAELNFTLSELSEKGVLEHLAAKRAIPSARGQAVWNAIQQAPCSKGVGYAHRYRNAYCDGEDDEYITMEPIEKGHGLCMDSTCYDNTTLLQWLEKKSRLPHSKEEMQPEIVQWLMTRPAPWMVA